MSDETLGREMNDLKAILTSFEEQFKVHCDRHFEAVMAKLDAFASQEEAWFQALMAALHAHDKAVCQG